MLVGFPRLDRRRRAKRATEIDAATEHEKAPRNVGRDLPTRGKVSERRRHEHGHTCQSRCEAEPSRELLHPMSVLRCGVELTLETRDLLGVELVF